ncbi:DUF2326 domain-containing protein [Bacillus cereus group sp. BcHK140]|uniref:DUF2326 domain-containing protein n=1 Tax=Bacillus cereus group sp. BcHK140 TaxID=3018092 RepID=UPI0022E7250E|nr:DUF2326 domain-containing protein [Bacillus cereus group sp. BcHK140]MDA1919829.1 DUF2326 domain-containing protein [Bacillus cereus group sp. BcHK140]
MRIKQLIVRKSYPRYEVIRNIKFNLKGLSLIVDNTSDLAEDSGNNVGKTTAIKIIDLCLGGKTIKSLYYDSDTKSENTEIKSFLNEYKVEAELILIDNKENEISIIRQLFNRGKKFINGESKTEREFWTELKRILFNSCEEHPTLRQLIPKFVRVDETTSGNMIKYLPGSNFNSTYDTIYLFLLDILKDELLNKKDSLSIQLQECEKKLKFYEKDVNISSVDSLKQRKELIEDELTILIKKRNKLDYMETYKEELQKKRALTVKINELEEYIQLIEFDINSIQKSILKLNDEKSNINTKQIRQLYNEAKVYIDSLEKTYEDVLEFHNAMIQNRINFISRQFDSKKSELRQALEFREYLLEEKKQITIDVLDEGLLDELNLMNTQIESLNIEIGGIEQSLKILEGAEIEKLYFIEQINQINRKMNPDIINEKIKVFNKYFALYCEKLYGEKYLFVYNNNWKEQKKFPVSLDAFKGNVGTGMKKGVIVAFDLAYMKYAEVMEISAPQFVIHDKLENTHINQLKTIFDLCQEINGQYIIPILRERVDKLDENVIERAKVLELSTNNKFFKVK